MPSKCFIIHAVTFVPKLISKKAFSTFFFFFLQKTPVEFFGLPFDDATFHDAPFDGSYGILTSCNGVLHDIGQEHIYDVHKDLISKRSEREVKKSFLVELSKLDPGPKERCFVEIVSALGKGGGGLEHIKRRLNEGVWNEIIDDTTQIIP